MVMDTLGIDVGVLDSANMKTFKRMTMGTQKFTYEGAVAWLVTLSKISALVVCLLHRRLFALLDRAA